MLTKEETTRSRTSDEPVLTAPLATIDTLLRETKFGRNRFLKMMGAVLFGGAVLPLLRIETAEASPYCCGPSPACACCTGDGCCSTKCRARTGCCSAQGWWCGYGGTCYFCKDWYDADSGDPCICAAATGPDPGSTDGHRCSPCT